MTLSAGVCSSGYADDADTLVRKADRALYWAKEGGRNTTFLYTEEAATALIDQFAVLPQPGRSD